MFKFLNTNYFKISTTFSLQIYCSDLLSEALGISGTCSSDSDAAPTGPRKRRDVPSPREEAPPPEGDGTIGGGEEMREPTGEFDGTTYNRDGRPQRATFEAMQEVGYNSVTATCTM